MLSSLDSGDGGELPDSQSSRTSHSLPLRLSRLPDTDHQHRDSPAPVLPQAAIHKRCRDESIVSADEASSVVTEHSLDADNNWKQYQTHFIRTGFPTKKGIIWGLKHWPGSRRPCEGNRLRYCIDAIIELLRGQRDSLEYKIGICHDAMLRWERYEQPSRSGTWVPDWLVLIERPGSRESAGYLEAALINYFVNHKYYKTNSINKEHGDLGGEGPRHDNRACLPHYVYLAVKRR